MLRYWFELTTAETAAELGISESAVKTHASRGRERLRAVLTEAEEPESGAVTVSNPHQHLWSNPAPNISAGEAAVPS